MSKVFIMIIAVFMLTGCAQEQQAARESDIIAPLEEVKPAEPVQPLAAEKITADITQEIKTIIRDVQQDAAVKSIKGAEEIIAENRWGFAIYDPKAGIEKFYTSKGTLLGSKKR